MSLYVFSNVLYFFREMHSDWLTSGPNSINAFDRLFLDSVDNGSNILLSSLAAFLKAKYFFVAQFLYLCYGKNYLPTTPCINYHYLKGYTLPVSHILISCESYPQYL